MVKRRVVERRIEGEWSSLNELCVALAAGLEMPGWSMRRLFNATTVSYRFLRRLFSGEPECWTVRLGHLVRVVDAFGLKLEFRLVRVVKEKR
jgi:hypothetical protein